MFQTLDFVLHIVSQAFSDDVRRGEKRKRENIEREKLRIDKTEREGERG